MFPGFAQHKAEIGGQDVLTICWGSWTHVIRHNLNLSPLALGIASIYMTNKEQESKQIALASILKYIRRKGLPCLIQK